VSAGSLTGIESITGVDFVGRSSLESGSKKLIFVIAEDWYFWSHRLPLAKAAQRNGYDVIIATRVHNHAKNIRDEGFRLFPLQLSRESYSPLRELRTILQLRRLYRTERPDIVHHVALKPILYGSLAALGRSHIQVINALAGLGYLVASSSFKARLLRLPIWNAFRFLLNRPGSRVLLQNAEDREFVTTKLKVPVERTVLIRGAGVDCEVFHPAAEPTGIPVVVLSSRMLWNKGIAEFVETARLLKQEGVNARFVLVGDVDPGSPSGMPRKTLVAWHEEGVIEWWGQSQQMANVYQNATLVCLPSHGGEGVPKVLLEAASCGRAIVTSDVPGCRDIVRHNVNGLLVPAKTVRELATAIRYLLDNDDVRRQMGATGREIVLREFSQEIVVNKTMSLYNELVGTELGYAAAATTVG
jgi:glycosyltransferase involved in cell wall biosynthesis